MPTNDWDEEEFGRDVVRLNAVIIGLVVGTMAGLLVLLATNWLVVKGGDLVGPHLSLLSQFFYGYSVSFPGSLIGFLYGLLMGFVAGWSTARIYNAIVALRDR